MSLQALAQTQGNKKMQRHHGQNMLDYGLILSLMLLVVVGTVSMLHGYVTTSAFNPLQRSL